MTKADAGERPVGARRPRRRLLVRLAGLALIGLLAVIVPPLIVLATTAHQRTDAAGAQPAPVAIVLGAGLDASGRPSWMLQRRLDTAIDLYRRGVVRAMVMSGDHSTTDHDEVAAMAAYVQARGVPTAAVVLDHAGFDTYSSCYRAHSVWGIEKAVVVSQSFHLPRAVFLCRRLGVDVTGVAAADAEWSVTAYGWAREIPAIDKALLDLARHREPTFPGPREHDLDALTR